ncbi:hypothetical protein HBI37_207400 [Parastagonospora nodorum]|nr:hypothetical protein HBI37_207400 [Parastagonospora nodorum]KAH6345202.1 hypothetical protein HBI36_162600 [Parastagonospora nodorum]
MKSESDAYDSSEGQSPYDCQPLKLGQIRLLQAEWVTEPSLQHVFPWTSSRKSLELHTVRVELEEQHNYKAVSYVWGTAPASVSVMCNGCPIFITPTLHELLGFLAGAERNLWVDAVCIDQRNSEEKAMQIPLMRLIYSKAEAVVIWLGASHSSVTAFMEELPRVCKLSRLWTSTDPTGDIHWRGKDWPPDGDPFWEGLFHLVRHQWFARLWTFQEVVLAKRGYMVYGNTWRLLEDFVAFYYPEQGASGSYVVPGVDHYDQIPNLDLSLSIAYNACSVINWRHSKGSDTPVQLAELPSLLYHVRHRRVTEQVDRVWAIAGVLSESLQARLSSKIDYGEGSRSQYWTTYLSFSKAVFEEEQSLVLLNIPPSVGQHHIELPSWCPDLSSSELACNLKINHSWRARQLPKARQRIWWFDPQHDVQKCVEKRAAVVDHSLKSISINNNDSILNVRGFVVDTIEEVVDGTGLLPLWRRDPCNDWRDLDPANAAIRTIVGYYLQALELVQRTRCKQDDTTLPKEFVSCLFRDSRFSTEAERFCVDMFHMLKLVMEGMEEGYRHIAPDKRHWGAKLWRILTRLIGHSFFATSSGRFGIAAPGCKRGDRICVFYGGEPLYILQHEGTGVEAEAVKFGGVAFIPHLMDQDQRDDARLITDETFAIS